MTWEVVVDILMLFGLLTIYGTLQHIAVNLQLIANYMTVDQLKDDESAKSG